MYCMNNLSMGEQKRSVLIFMVSSRPNLRSNIFNNAAYQHLIIPTQLIIKLIFNCQHL